MSDQKYFLITKENAEVILNKVGVYHGMMPMKLWLLSRT